MTAQMADVVAAYQESRGLAVDRVMVRRPDRRPWRRSVSGQRVAFTMVITVWYSGHGRFGSVFRAGGGDGCASPAAAPAATPVGPAVHATPRWDGRNAMFLGCYRWSPQPAGMSCSWSGPTPLQLVGLVEDPASPGLTRFSILYARSTAV